MSTCAIWIGIAEVLSKPDSQVLADVNGAFVNVLAWASSAHGFAEKATELMESLGLLLIGLQQVEPLSAREQRTGLASEIRQVAAEMLGNPQHIRYTTFHTWLEVNA